MPLSTGRAPKRGTPRSLFASKGQMAAHSSPRVHSAWIGARVGGLESRRRQPHQHRTAISEITR